MSETTTELKHEIQKSLALLRTLSDEVRVKIHLAGMDAKDEWKKLEPELAVVEKLGHDLSESTRKAATDVVERVRALHSKLHSASH